MHKLLITITLFLLSSQSFCQEEIADDKRCNDPDSKIECGWHYGYVDPLGSLEVKEEENKEIEITIAPKEEEKEKCTNKENWSEECGFIDPGTDFDFQAMQRDVFLKNLLMKSNNPKSVENMQRYQKWLVSKAVQASKMWEFNLAQKPELSASINNPVTSFGLNMTTQLRDDTTEAVFEEIRGEEGIYVWFTRSDCPFCHRQISSMLKMEKEYDIKIRNVSLDNSCMEGFKDDCLTAPFTLEPARALNIEIVPSFFVYLPKDESWIRIANGVESRNTIANRIKNFFLGVKAAHINGVDNSSGNTPSVDFSTDDELRLRGTTRIMENENDNN